MQYIDRGDGVRLAAIHQPGRGPTVVFLPGYRSDMSGGKATMFADICAASGQAMLRLDYSGHGASGGAFTDGTIRRWTDDALLVIDRLTTGTLLLVGSSMGGWIALLIALASPDRVAAIIGIAAAPDFTESLMWASMTPDERSRLMAEGQLSVPSAYGDDLIITKALIESGRNDLVLAGPIAIRCPVRLVQGQRDADVPWETALTLAARLESDDVRITLIKDAEHRLSRPGDLSVLRAVLNDLLGNDGA